MCGIAGIFAYRAEAPPVDGAELLRIREAMARRGPDGAGVWLAADGRVGLAHRRLAVIDPSFEGAQPMAAADGRYRITFNGEIYNYRELRKELQAKGFRFCSRSDTEVLLHLYADRGERMVHALRGMYAFAIWDEDDQSLFLARDPFGIKPLYYADDGRSFRFASQVKALLKGGAIETAAEPAGSVGFLLWGCVPDPYTLYRDIRALPAGTYKRVTRRRAHPAVEYFDIGDELRAAQEVARGLRQRSGEIIRAALQDSVRQHLVADVPVGLFLSAGLDSSTVAGLATEQSSNELRAITLGFPEYRGTANDEVPLATLIAARYGIAHEADWIDREDFQAELESIIEAMDQPTTDGVNTYFVSRAAAHAGMKVALSGLGGDELFAGYPGFRQIPASVRCLAFTRALPGFGKLTRTLGAWLLGRVTSPKYAALIEYGGRYSGAYLLRRALFMPWELRSMLDAATVAAGLEELATLPRLEASIRGLRSSQSRIAALELGWYMRNQLLRDADWAGMAHSVEIRTPLVDVALFRALAPLLASESGPTKADLAPVLRTPLPAEVLRRAKSGFATPVGDWTAAISGGSAKDRGLREWARRVLPEQPRMFRALAVVSDAYGGAGGIAKFNRDLLETLASMADCAQVVALPRVIHSDVGPIPTRVKFVAAAAGGKGAFVRCALAHALRGHFDVLVAGHINLAPLAAVLAFMRRTTALLVIHGIDAWHRHPSALVRASLARFDGVIGVSRLTIERFTRWSGVRASSCHLLPNCVDMAKYAPGPKSAVLLQRLGLQDRTIIMTLGRLANEERYKGFDEVIDVLPSLARRVPDISYVICGEGPDRPRLETKARVLGVADRVVFTGFVPEQMKADYYRLGDAYVMPSRGEGFGIVFLEALACGIPVLGSRIDGGREALLGGSLGKLADPSDLAEVEAGILETLRRGKGTVPRALAHYSREAFVERAAAIVRRTVPSAGTRVAS